MFDHVQRLHYVALDVLCVLLAALPYVILNLESHPFHRGFFCDDESIKYPYKKETIPFMLLSGITIPFCVIIMVVVETLSVYFKHLHSNSFIKNSYIATIYKATGTFLFGVAANQSLTIVVQHLTGRLKPHFLAVCDLDWSCINCSEGYIEDYFCQGNPNRVKESRLSFYSGHASFAMYCMLFLALYLQARLKGDWARLLRPTVQYALFAFAIYVGLSRISDYKHHWSDVLTGLIQGALLSILVVAFVSSFFKQQISPYKEKEQEDSRAASPETPRTENQYLNSHEP
ncbi:phospholipid phosphatase 1-like [Sorex araneus]|uniref:phospholipid phosphatase 1-like n=1 Tax=Sorex araneus TaxID=42254 RepID=UPI002433ABBD|nr:phospholipid phosphatase 1-like [Sorex araneus]